jgi:hypothetical protein
LLITIRRRRWEECWRARRLGNITTQQADCGHQLSKRSARYLSYAVWLFVFDLQPILLRVSSWPSCHYDFISMMVFEKHVPCMFFLSSYLYVIIWLMSVFRLVPTLLSCGKASNTLTTQMVSASFHQLIMSISCRNCGLFILPIDNMQSVLSLHGQPYPVLSPSSHSITQTQSPPISANISWVLLLAWP